MDIRFLSLEVDFSAVLQGFFSCPFRPCTSLRIPWEEPLNRGNFSTPKTVSIWAAQGQIPVVLGPHLDGSHTYLFDRAVLQQWKEERLAPNEAAALLGISTPTLYGWMRQGKLHVITGPGPVGHGVWYRRDEVMSLAAAHAAQDPG